MRFHICETELGWIGVVLSPAGLRATTLPRRSRDGALGEVLALGAQRGSSPKTSSTAWPRGCGATPAARPSPSPRRWTSTASRPSGGPSGRPRGEIPRGQTCSYAELAARAGRPGAARAVGQAMARNPWPIIVPCHRVVASDGGLGGYGGGLDMKERLLRLEQ